MTLVAMEEQTLCVVQYSPWCSIIQSTMTVKKAQTHCQGGDGPVCSVPTRCGIEGSDSALFFAKSSFANEDEIS